MLTATLLLVAQVAGSRGGVPPVLTEAQHAVTGDSVAAVRARWSGRARRTPGDRVAGLGLATLARLTWDYDEAQRRYEALFVPHPARRDFVDAWARIGLARALEEHGRPARTEALLTDAVSTARRLGDRTAEGHALYRLSFAVTARAGGAGALAYADSAVRTLHAGDEVHAAGRCRRSRVMAAMGRPAFMDSVEAATAAARRGDGVESLGECLRAAGVAYRSRGVDDSARMVIAELVALRRRARDRSGLSVALMVEADFLRALGDFGGAVRRFREALVEARASRNLFIEASVSLGLGGTALTMNDHAAAREYVDGAIAAFAAAQDSLSLALASSFRPFVSMAAGELDAARAQTHALLGHWQRIGDWQHMVQLYRQLAAIEMRAGDYDAAARALDGADAAVRVRARDPDGTARVFDRGRLALHRGRLDEAERHFAGYLAALGAADRLMRYEAQVRMGEVHARRSHYRRAWESLSAADRDLNTWRGTLDDPALRTLAFQASAFEANDRNASVARILAALVRGGMPEEAFAIAEQRRARELADRLTKARAFAEGTPVGTQAGAVRPFSDAGGDAPDAAALGRVLPGGTAILEYVTGIHGAPTTLLVLQRDAQGAARVSGYTLPPADSLVHDIARLVALFEAGDDPRTIAATLGRDLLHPALRDLGTSVRRLVIVPDGPLHRVPWDALRLADGRYVVEDYTVSLAPSAHVLARLWRVRRREDGVTRLLAFGNPRFDAVPAASRPGDVRQAFTAAGGLPPLAYTATEARLVARYAPDGEVRLGKEASAAYLRRESLEDYDVLHFATHALVDEQSVARSALALSGTDVESGFVSPLDMAVLRLDAALVVLSACRSAGGVVVDGEGVQGLTAPLLLAGTRSVVATSWRIGDARTVPFIRAFYDGMADGLPVGEALRAAKLDAIRRGAPPSEWAAFATIGDAFTLVPLEPPRAPAWPLFAAGTLALGLTVGAARYSRMRRRRTGDWRSTPPGREARTHQR